MIRTILVVLAAALLLVSCGGGSSSTTSTATTSQSTAGQAQGVYSGTSNSTTGSTFSSIVLPNDNYYAIYGTSSGNTFLVYGMLVGQGASKNGTYTANVTDFYYTGATYTGTVTATYVAGTSLSGTLSETGISNSATFSGTALPSSQFNYNTPATLSAVAGTWTGSFLDGSFGSMTISSTGTFSGSNVGCNFTGTVTPDAAKNFYTISVTFANSTACLLPGQTATGIAVTYQVANSTTHQLIAAGTAGNKGTLFLATR